MSATTAIGTGTDAPRATTLYMFLVAAAGGSFLLSMAVGPAAIGPAAVVAAFAGTAPEATELIVREIRMPRALLGLLVGATLGLAGAGLQGLFRNPLAEPGLLGASAMAALGGVIAMYFGLYAAFPFALPACAMGGSLVAVAFLLLVARHDGSVLTVILAGVAISSLGAALISLAINLSGNPFAVTEIVFWLMGSLADRTMDHVWLALPFMIVGWVLILACGRALDALTLGDETAQSLGIGLGRTRTMMIFGTALAVGAAVAVSGAIGFVGLVVPHILRPFVGYEPRRLLPASALGGAILLLLADAGVRLVPTGAELRLGVVTALIGVPFFLFLIFRTRREMA